MKKLLFTLSVLASLIAMSMPVFAITTISDDAGFNPSADGYIYSVVAQTDGKILVGGAFTMLAGQPCNNLGRLNADGTLDTSFNPQANGYVNVIFLQADGKILIGGGFTSLFGQTRNYIARLNADATLEMSFNPGVDLSVYSFAIQADGKIIVGGYNYIRRFNDNGSLDNSFYSYTDGTIRNILLQPDGKILVTGNFTVIGGYSREYNARLNINGSLDTGFINPAPDHYIEFLSVQTDGKILTSDNTRLNVNGTLDTSYIPPAGGNSSQIVQADGKILLVKNEYDLKTNSYKATISRYNADGSLNRLNPGANKAVYSVALQVDGKILAGGNFTSLAGKPCNYFGRLNLDGSLDTSFNAGASYDVTTLAVQPDGKILAGGYFTVLGGESHNYIGRLNADGSPDSGFNGSANSYVLTLALQADGKILVGGTFTTLDGQARSYIGRLNADGSLDTGFNPEVNDTVYSLVVQADGKILVGGVFTTLGGQARNYIGRLNADGSLDTSFNSGAYGGNVYSLAVQADGKILVGGSFTTLAGQARSNIGRLNANGSLDTTFNPGSDDYISSLSLQSDGKILVAGLFTTLGGQSRNYIGRLNPDGSLDSELNPGADGAVYTLALQNDGKIIAGGNFTTFAGEPNSRIGRVSNTKYKYSYLFDLQVGVDSVLWSRHETQPDVWRVTFEESSDGLAWTEMGAGVRTANGWLLSGLTLPIGQNRYIRARGYSMASGTKNGSSVYEFVMPYVLQLPVVATGWATPTGMTSATINGSVSHTSNTAGWVLPRFEYGTTTNYGSVIPMGTYFVGSGTANLSYDISGLTCGTTYHYRLVGENSAGITYGSDATFETTSCPLVAPSYIEVQAPTIPGQLNITWVRTSGSHVRIYRSTANGDIGYLIADYQTGIKYTDTNLLSQTKYYYTVRSVNNTGNESTNTVQVSGTTLDKTPPAVPGNPAATFTGPGTAITVTWTKPTDTDFSHARIYRSTTSGELGTLVYDNVTTTSKLDSGLTNSVTYYYTVRSVDTLGNESVNTIQADALVSVPDSGDINFKITSLAFTKPVSGDALSLTWSNPVELNKLEIYRSNIENQQGTLIYTGTGTDTTFTDTGLVTRSTYFYTFVLYDASGNIKTMPQQGDFPNETNPPLPVTGLTATMLADSKVRLNWLRSPSKDLSIINDILWDNGNDSLPTGNFVKIIDPGLDNATISTWTSGSLTPGTTYRFAVRSGDDTYLYSTLPLVSVTPVNSVSGVVSAMVTSPAAGTSVYGNSVTITTGMVAGQVSGTAQVQFQYRKKGNLSWSNIGTPDTSPPFTAAWDVTALADGDGEYELIAIATSKASGNPDISPPVTTVIRTTSGATVTENNDGTVQTATQPVFATAPASITTQTPLGAATVSLPAGAVSGDTLLTMFVPVPAAVATVIPSGYVNTNLYVDISFGSGQHIIGGSTPATIEIPYLDENDNHVTDDTGLNVYDIRIFDYYNSTWTELPTFVNTEKKVVYATTSTFSLFAALIPPKLVTSGWNLLSVPLTPTPNTSQTIFGPASVYANWFMVINPATGAFSNSPTVAPGIGYFVKGNGNSFTATGTETPDAPFSIAIKKGWNMIGNPFRYKVKVADLGITYNSSNYTIAAAEAAGLVDGTLFGAENSAFQMYTVLNGGTINPWKGYYILSDVDCTLVVPNTPAQ